MKPASAVLICSGVLALAGCNRAPESAPAAAPATGAPATGSPTDAAANPNALPPPPIETGPAVTAPSDSSELRLRGNGVMGKDGYGITPCGESTQRMADFGPEAVPILDTFFASGAREFFIDAWATRGTDGRLAITRIERIHTEGPGCEEALSGVVFVARGNEPFWSVRSGQDGVVLERPGVAAISGPFNGVTESNGGRRIESETPFGPLVVQLTPVPCSDGMSDSIYGWTAKATLRNEEWSGCGFAGLPADQY